MPGDCETRADGDWTVMMIDKYKRFRRWQDKVILAMDITVFLGLLTAGAVGLAVFLKLKGFCE